LTKSVKNYIYFNGNKDKTLHLKSMKKYVIDKQEQDKLLEKMVKPLIYKIYKNKDTNPTCQFLLIQKNILFIFNRQ